MAQRAVPYMPPRWAASLPGTPRERLRLGSFPTPLVQWQPPGLPAGTECWLKRDDLSGMELSGNKVRKLEFILADALRQGADSVVSCGGVQSNHCRAVAVAARMLGLEPHLVLRLEDPSAQDPSAPLGLEGNLLLSRLVGAEHLLVSRKQYRDHGAPGLIEEACAQLRAQGRRPYAIPLGGSNALGSWGYVDAVEELMQQANGQCFSDIVLSTGSGGSLAGLAVGVHLSGLGAKITAFSANDSPAYFYRLLDKELLPGLLGAERPRPLATELCDVRNARGQGYAVSSQEELAVVVEVARHTGVAFDPVYSGKAVFHFLQLLREGHFGQRVLFWHTGGIFGLWAKLEELSRVLGPAGSGRALL